jgi:hypothetical protein
VGAKEPDQSAPCFIFIDKILMAAQFILEAAQQYASQHQIAV